MNCTIKSMIISVSLDPEKTNFQKIELVADKHEECSTARSDVVP